MTVRLTPSFSMVVGGYEGGAHDKGVPDISGREDFADKNYQVVSKQVTQEENYVEANRDMRLECRYRHIYHVSRHLFMNCSNNGHTGCYRLRIVFRYRRFIARNPI